MKTSAKYIGLTQLCPTRGQHAAQSKVLCCPAQVFDTSKTILPKFDICDAGDPQCHYVTYVTIAVGIRMFSVY